MNELSLFTGAGGGLLASKHLLGWRTVCYVEWDKYCQQVLQARIRDGLLDDAPIWDDAATFDGRPWRGCVDIITSGFPCQPFSVAGKQQGENDERNMWPETIRVIREVRPRYAFLENVPGLLTSGYYGTILGDLAESGYDARWRVLSAAEMGAPHKRDRLWIYCHPNRKSKSIGSINEKTSKLQKNVADAERERFYKRYKPQERQVARCSEIECSYWQIEPDVGRVAHGVASRVDRLKAIGNGQVPLVVAAAWNLLTRGDDDEI